MNCRDAQDRLLDTFDTGGPSAEQPDLALHLRTCPVCEEFAESQRVLDLRLRKAISATELDSAFRQTLKKRIKGEQRQLWADWLPDAAHLAGSLAAILLCIALLPFPAHTILWIGAILAVATYSLVDLSGSFLRD